MVLDIMKACGNGLLILINDFKVQVGPKATAHIAAKGNELTVLNDVTHSDFASLFFDMNISRPCSVAMINEDFIVWSIKSLSIEVIDNEADGSGSRRKDRRADGHQEIPSKMTTTVVAEVTMVSLKAKIYITGRPR